MIGTLMGRLTLHFNRDLDASGCSKGAGESTVPKTIEFRESPARSYCGDDRGKGGAKLIGYVALLRAVNVGGTGKLPMTMLAQMCETVGFEKVKTYIASGNVVFRSDRSEDQVRSTLEDQLTPTPARASA